jgi:ubiquinone/menaquinone biosynthesis C-methylase UbiE
MAGMLTDREQVREQYRDNSNLAARAAIYRFGDPAAPPWPRWVFDQLDLPPAAAARVLEIGCGDGALWRRNLDRLPPAWRITLSDLSPGMLAAARTALSPAAPSFRFVQADAVRLPFADGAFDAVVANHMLYHVPRLDRALRDVRRVLAAGGRLFAATNSDAHLAPMQRLINEFLGDASPLREPMLFSMENGAAAIAATFSQVEARHLRGELRVDDPEAVVRYVMSVEGAPELLTGGRLDALRQRARDEVERAGAFVLPTAAGMFVACT